MPPTQSAAMASAFGRCVCVPPTPACSNDSIINLIADSNACLTARSVRETSFGKPIIGNVSPVCS
jgi:hypothetical protein